MATLIVALASSVVLAAGDTVDLRGRVVEVNGFDVRIEIDSTHLPQPGDAVDLRFTLPDGDELSVGTWRVTAVDSGKVLATVVRYTGQPAPGYIAVIAASGSGTSSSQPIAVPQQRPTAVPPPSTEPSGSGAAQPDWSPGPAPAEVQKQLDALQSVDSVERQSAAKILYRHYRNDPYVQEEVNRVLLEQYNKLPKDPVQADAMSHLCNILGASGNASYAATLRRVSDSAENSKLRKYATKNLRRLK